MEREVKGEQRYKGEKGWMDKEFEERKERGKMEKMENEQREEKEYTCTYYITWLVMSNRKSSCSGLTLQ